MALDAAIDLAALIAAENDIEVITLKYTGDVAAAGIYALSQLAMERDGDSFDNSVDRAGVV